ncbi:MAG: YcxB family protein, partial [Tepidiformaceae bacterium]
PWGAVANAERHPTFWYFRSRGGAFIVPDRAFPSQEALADFEAMVKDRVPPSAWREPWA